MPGLVGNHIRIVLLDNNSLVRAGIRRLIESHAGLEVVGESGNFKEGIEMCSSLKPDIILLDIDLIRESDLRLIRSLIEKSNQARVILMADKADSQVILQAVQEGVKGVVLKTQRPENLYKAIEKVHAGEAWLERTMIANLLTHLSRDHKPPKLDPEMERITQLSDREAQIIELIGLGLKNKQIAMRLCISETTVRHHLTSIFRKLEVSDRLELLVFAHRFGLTKPSP